ncbi:hypothetical protein M433DRAFT_154298 [Acidomyces richmondensis BFW]|nr:MAG: hypothetical protein FE78DRAFT_90368 [Acidomyces sp. 'richmondensis']KYG45627.1 hypothetical protein M433DRAFT_154298 [Acidomyces richmondensis BFW]
MEAMPQTKASGQDADRSGKQEHIPDKDVESTVDSDNGLSTISPIVRQYSPTAPDLPRRIHILGLGSIGKLVAHSLRGIPNPPPITLIFHRPKLLTAWKNSRQKITIQDEGGFKTSRGGFDVELMPEVRRQHGVELEKDEWQLSDIPGVRPHEAAQILQELRHEQQQQQQQESPETDKSTTLPPATPYRRPEKNAYPTSTTPIHNLIVAMKAPHTVAAISAIKHRLLPTSTICFLQNGMGVLDDVSTYCFPDPHTRPIYVQGVITHGVNVPPEVAVRDPFFAVHAGHGTIALGVMPKGGISRSINRAKSGEDEAAENNSRSDLWAPSARYLLRTLTRTPVLCAVGFTPTELLQYQLEKLAINSIINPLTSLLDARNGALLHNFALTRTMRLMLAETSLVIRSLPELAALPNAQNRFSATRLEQMVVSVAERTKENVSSMLADVRAGRRTEVEWINGYVVRRGEEVGVKAVVNYAMMQAVIGKQMMVWREVEGAVPMMGENLAGD